MQEWPHACDSPRSPGELASRRSYTYLPDVIGGWSRRMHHRRLYGLGCVCARFSKKISTTLPETITEVEKGPEYQMTK